jgi:hypothetical protein
MISVVMSGSLELDRGSGSADHKHAASLTYLDGLVVYVNPYDRVCAICSASETISPVAVSRASLKDLS